MFKINIFQKDIKAKLLQTLEMNLFKKNKTMKFFNLFLIKCIKYRLVQNIYFFNFFHAY